MRVISQFFIVVFVAVLNVLCSKGGKAEDICDYWIGRQLLFPENFETDICFDSINSLDYKIVTYIDSCGCIPCRMSLGSWQQWLTFVKSASDFNLEMLLVVNTDSMDNISRNIETSGYNGEVWIDKHDSFNRINNLPIEESYRTFLLDSDNRVLAIGNPIINGGVSNMYIELLGINEPITTSDQHIDLGAFNWKEKQVCRFKILNETDNVLYIDTIIPSCECTTYSCYSDSVISGRSFSIYVYYKADSPGMFRRDISVYFEGEEKPLILNIEGEAKLES